MHNFSRVLVLAPHTDDGEFGCGGTIARFLDQGVTVHYVAFSAAEKSVPAHLPKDILKHEVMAATATLGIPGENVIIEKFEVRDFPEHRQEILETLIRLKSRINPDLVLLPSLHDIHQDHNTIAQEGLRAFKTVTMLGYEVPWNNLVFENTLYIILEDSHVQKKIDALSCYKSQEHRIYANEEYLRSLTRVRGTQIGVNYAECFEVIRVIL